MPPTEADLVIEKKRRLASWVIWWVPLLWTVNMVVARTAPGVIDPHVLALGRWSLAGVILAYMARAELWAQRVYVWQHKWRYLTLGACGMWICGAWVYLAGRTTVAMNISLIYSSAPVLIAVGSVLWLGERFSKRQVVGVVLAMTGVVHVVVQGSWAQLSQVQWVAGDLWILAAAIAWAAYALLQKRWTTVLGSTAQLAAICFGGVVVLLPFSVWEVWQPDAPVLGWQALSLVVFVALFPGVAAYWIYGWTQKVLGPARVAMTLYLGPLYTAIVAWLILGEALGWHHLVGGALILSGVGMVIAAKR
jgi:drug/metabolite transporter (DMT)-like permease